MIKIAIADDHQLFRQGLKELLNQNENIAVVAEMQNGEEVLDFFNNKTCDIIFLDINMPVLDGIETAKEIIRREENVKIAILTMHDSPNYLRRMLEIGVDGYILKSASKEELLLAIQKLNNQENFYSKEIQLALNNEESKNGVSNGQVHLSRREKEILELICEECLTKQIADKLFISTYTVDTHRKNMLKKTNSKNVAGLVKYAIENKLFV